MERERMEDVEGTVRGAAREAMLPRWLQLCIVIVGLVCVFTFVLLVMWIAPIP